MSWYKKANEIRNIQDRNRVHKRLRTLTGFVEQLYAIKKNLSFSPMEAKNVLESISSDKFFTSFPDIQKKFNRIDFKILDNPDRASDIIEEVLAILMDKVDHLKQQLQEFNKQKLPNKFKNTWE